MATAADILGLSRNSRIVARWSKHYQQLCVERDRLLDRDCSSGEISSVKIDDLGEAASEESQRCLALVAARATQTSIVDVLEAIRRIERGTYGICEMTGEPIEAERLRAIPWTRYSLQGQKELEKAGFFHRHALPGLESAREMVLADGEEGGPEEESDKTERGQPSVSEIGFAHSAHELAISSPSPPLEERVGERRPFNAASTHSSASVNKETW